VTIKTTNKKSRKKEREKKRGKTMEEGRKKLGLLHPLGVARYFSPPLLHKFQKGSFFTNSSSSNLKLHGKNNN